MKIEIGLEPLRIEDVVLVAKQRVPLTLSTAPAFRQKIEASHRYLTSLLERGQEVYGVTTGYGDSCTTVVDRELIEELPRNLVRYHNCGLGDFFNETEARAIQVSRIASLTQGVSGVRMELLEFLVNQLNLGISPHIPKEGSVGASGDLTPLSYLAATLLGEGEVMYRGGVRPTMEVYRELGIEPIGLKPKEGLAIMNGTAVMTALACLAYRRAEHVCEIATKVTAANVIAILGNPRHFDELLFSAKPHPGQSAVATWLRGEFTEPFVTMKAGRLQDRYSLRCAPHVVGVAVDALRAFRSFIEIELNSANDNPLIDGENGKIVHGGNFYGGHIAFVMDSLKVQVANVADLLDRQLALLVDPKFNNGLPANLSGSRRGRSVHHGYKAVQIAASAWTAEALKQSLPASIFSRSTECHNQDKVSMGTISARDCIRSLELTEQVVAASAMAAAQAIELRLLSGELTREQVGESLLGFQTQVFALSPFLENDRPLDRDLRHVVEALRERQVRGYA